MLHRLQNTFSHQRFAPIVAYLPPRDTIINFQHNFREIKKKSARVIEVVVRMCVYRDCVDACGVVYFHNYKHALLTVRDYPR